MKKILYIALIMLPMAVLSGCTEDLSYLKEKGKFNGYENSSYGTDNDASKIQMVDLGLSVKWGNHRLGFNAYRYSSGEIYVSSEGVTYDFGASSSNLTREYSTGDSGSIAGTRFDHATVQNNAWQTPTKEQFEELIRKCTFKIDKSSEGKRGVRIIGPNNNSIFWETKYESTTEMELWTSSFEIDSGSVYAWHCTLRLYDIKNQVEVELVKSGELGKSSTYYNKYICPVQAK